MLTFSGQVPGGTYIADVHDPEERVVLTLTDELLLLEEDTVDVILGEVQEPVGRHPEADSQGRVPAQSRFFRRSR